MQAFRLEIKTDCGRVNLFGMMALIFLFVFTSLEKIMADSLSVVHPVTPLHERSITTVQLALFFAFSLVVVAFLERQTLKSQDAPKKGRRPVKRVHSINVPISTPVPAISDQLEEPGKPPE